MDEIPKSPEQLFGEWKQRIQGLIDEETSRGESKSFEDVVVDKLVRKDFIYFGVWEKGGGAPTLDHWLAVTPKEATSSLRLINWCRQQETKKQMKS